jgi:hypothetical protein
MSNQRRGKKPKEGVWGNLRSRLPQDLPTDFAEDPKIFGVAWQLALESAE